MDKITERKLIKIAQSSYTIASNDAMEQLIEANKGLIKSIANQFVKYDIDFEDLYAYGQIGFIKAVKTFKLKSKKNKLCTYAYLWILQSIQRGLAENNMIYVPDLTKKLYWSIQSFKQEYYEAHSCYPTIEIIAKQFKISKTKVRKTMLVISQVYSLDKTIDEKDKVSNASLVADDKLTPHEIAIKEEAKAQLYTVLSQCLTPKQLQVLIWTFGLDTNTGKLQAKEIAKRLDLSVPAVRKIQYSLLANLKHNKQLEVIYESLQ